MAANKKLIKDILGPQGEPIDKARARAMCDPLGTAIEMMAKNGTLPKEVLDKIKGKTLTREEANKIVYDATYAGKIAAQKAFDQNLAKSLKISKDFYHT